MKDVTYDKFDFQSVKYTAHILLFMIALMFERISQIWHSNKYNNRFFERYVVELVIYAYSFADQPILIIHYTMMKL